MTHKVEAGEDPVASGAESRVGVSMTRSCVGVLTDALLRREALRGGDKPVAAASGGQTALYPR